LNTDSCNARGAESGVNRRPVREKLTGRSPPSRSSPRGPSSWSSAAGDPGPQHLPV